MDEENLKNDAEIDNSRLEELIKQDITPQMQREVFDILKKSRLFLPIDFGEDAFKGIENSEPGDVIEGPKGFSIQFLTDDNGNKAVPLFTSEEMMQKAGVHTSVMVMYMSDLAGMLAQSDRYSIISINPFTEFGLNMPIEAFLAQFDIKPDPLRELIWDDNKKSHLPLFTDIEEFKKIFEKYSDDVYPQAYYFADLVKVAKVDFVINPASESLILSPEVFKGQ